MIDNEKILKEFLILRNRVNRDAKQMERLKAILKKEMTPNSSVDIPELSQTVCLNMKVTNRFDSSSFKLVHPDIYDSFVKEKKFLQLDVNHLITEEDLKNVG